MNTRFKLILTAIFLTAVTGMFIPACTAPEKPAAGMSHEEMVERGKYLVTICGCNDCHSPKMMTAEGPVPDPARLLSGHPENEKLAKLDTTEISPGKWNLGSSGLTAWAGGWGISFAANLTPDSLTGTGAWTEETFIKILRSGKFMGVDAGRPIMPPMPWQMIGQMTDDDLKSVFAYLKSLSPVKNAVHGYIPPNEIASMK